VKILSKYLTKEFCKLLVLCQFVFLFIYLIIDFLQKIDNFINADVSKGLMVQYFLFKAPFVMVQMMPVATLIAIIIMFSLMKKTNEILAIKTCGLNIFKIAQPIIIASVFLGIALFFFL
jgi:lipopolysaccharide export system permease protein